MAIKFFLILTLGLAITGRADAAFLETDKAILRGVDKITGRVRTMELPVGTLGHFGNLTVYAEKCLTRPPEETPENAAFLMITQPQGDHEHKVVFNGWMFSSNPAISAMEHPIYDIWVVSCPVTETAQPTLLKEDDNVRRLAEDETKRAVSSFGAGQELSDVEKEMLVRAQNRLALMRRLTAKADVSPTENGDHVSLPNEKNGGGDGEDKITEDGEPVFFDGNSSAVQQMLPDEVSLSLPDESTFQGVVIPNVSVESLADEMPDESSADTDVPVF